MIRLGPRRCRCGQRDVHLLEDPQTREALTEMAKAVIEYADHLKSGRIEEAKLLATQERRKAEKGGQP
jgi:hypothetical protein